MKNKIIFWLYCSAIIVIIILADLDLLPLHLLMPVPHYDWVAHLVLYGLFYHLLSRLLKNRRINLLGLSAERALVITVLFVTLEELSQILFSSRTFSIMDLLMGLLGIFIFRIRRSGSGQMFTFPYMSRRTDFHPSPTSRFIMPQGKTPEQHSRSQKEKARGRR